MNELVPDGHLAHFVRDTFRDELDLSAIMSEYSEERGFPPFHPVMMTALLMYAYCHGVYSSRRIAKGCVEPIFGQIKSGRGFARFSMRGCNACRAEWAMVSTASNLLKLARW